MAYTNDEEDILRQFGRHLCSTREDGGWSIEDLAKAADLDESFLHAVEAGEEELTLLSMNSVAVVLELWSKVVFV